jgi:hypothetical protein
MRHSIPRKAARVAATPWDGSTSAQRFKGKNGALQFAGRVTHFT